MHFATHQNKESHVWLAMRLGCCASKEDAVERQVLQEGNGHSNRIKIIYDQPQSIQHPRAEPIYHDHERPSTSQSMSHQVSQWVNSSRDFAARASSRASFSTLTRPRRSYSVHKVRPSISHPTNFQHLDNGLGLDTLQSMVDEAPMPIRRNRSFRRLELSIYVPNGCGRLSPLPDFEDEETWGTTKIDLEKPAQALVRTQDSRTTSLCSDASLCDYLIQRDPMATCPGSASHSRRSSTQSQQSNGTTATHERHLSGTTMNTMRTPLLSTWPEEPKAPLHEKPTLARSRTSGTLSPTRVLSRLPSPSRNRANTAPARPGSVRRGKTDVDEAIRELNTIIEECRASAYRTKTESPALINRPPPSPSHHVPYIAPSMRMHVRSETLSDIGSAFSAPLATSKSIAPRPSTSYSLTPHPRRTTTLPLPPPSRGSTMALCSNPITPPAPRTPTKSLARLATWLRRSTSQTWTSPSTPRSARRQSFYKCDPEHETTSTLYYNNSNNDNPTIHSRQDSNDSNYTAAMTIFSSSPTVFSSRSTSPDVPAKSPLRNKRVPAPLVLHKEMDMPLSPNRGLLKGMEVVRRDVGMSKTESPVAVGVAF